LPPQDLCTLGGKLRRSIRFAQDDNADN